QKEALKELKEEKNKTFCASDDAPGANGQCFLTKKKRKIIGKRLESFNQFWEAFNYKKDKAKAGDAWMDIPQLTKGTVQAIIDAAAKEAANRASLIAQNRTPIYAQGWISGRR